MLLKNIHTAVQYGCQMNMWKRNKLRFFSNLPAAAPQECFVLPMMSFNETRRDKTRPCDKIEDTGSNHVFFMLLPLAFLPLSAYFHDRLIFSLFLPLFFDKSLSGWNNGVLCTETHEKENRIIEIFITCCANANYVLYLLRLSFHFCEIQFSSLCI